MDDEDQINFFDLITDDDVMLYLFRFLNMQDLQNMSVTDSRMRQLIDIYNLGLKESLLSLPVKIKYTQRTIANLQQNIQRACLFLHKRPDECDITVNCNIFYSTNTTRVKSDPPIDAIRAIDRSGVKISLNIMFNFPHNPDLDVDVSYITIINSIFEYMNNIKSLSFELKDLRPFDQYFSSSIIQCLSISQQITSQLTSLSICKMDVIGDILINCLSKMTQLRSFSISEVKIFNTNAENLGTSLNTFLAPLSKLKLSDSFIQGPFVSILEVLPYMPNLLSSLTTLDISGNKLDEDTLHPNSVILSLNVYQHLNNLEELSLAHNEINDNLLHYLSEALNTLQSLRKLDLSYNKLTYSSIVQIIHLLPRVEINCIENLDMDFEMNPDPDSQMEESD